MTPDWAKLGLREPEPDYEDGVLLSVGWKVMPQYDFFFLYFDDPTVPGKPFSVSEQKCQRGEKMRYFPTIEEAAAHLKRLGCGRAS